MQIAARELLTSTWRPTPLSALSYIQDGLVAQWDAIENIGYGQHSSSPSSWVNLIDSTYNFTFYNSVSFADTYVQFNAGNAYTNAPFDAAMQSTLSSGYTDEILIMELPTFSSSTNNGICAICQGGLLTHSGMNVVQVRSTSAQIGQWNWCPPYGLLSFTNTGANGSCRLYRNATLQASSLSGFSISTTSSTNGITINKRQSYANYGFAKMKICARRIYSRIISASEVTFNYAIDRKRFSL